MSAIVGMKNNKRDHFLVNKIYSAMKKAILKPDYTLGTVIAVVAIVTVVKSILNKNVFFPKVAFILI